MITADFAQAFATEWIAAWNAHDLGRILSHYDDAFEMSSPFISKLAHAPNGILRGKNAVGIYWADALRRMPELQFRLIGVYPGAQSICLRYHSVQNLEAVEIFRFNAERKVVQAAAHYHPAPNR